MEVITIGTGSKGNCYLVKCSNDRTIVLDAGLRFKDITSHPAFPKFNNISYVFITHMHQDHSLSMSNFEQSGCEMITYKQLENKVQYFKFDGFDITTFPVAHNVPNWGIVIKDTQTNEKLCYMTDFYKCPKVENCDTYLYEVNYVEAYIDKMIEDGIDIKNCGFNNHNSLEKAVEYFASLNTRPKRIICCHLSKYNALEREILKQLKPFADKVEIAHTWRKDGNRQ